MVAKSCKWWQMVANSGKVVAKRGFDTFNNSYQPCQKQNNQINMPVKCALTPKTRTFKMFTLRFNKYRLFSKLVIGNTIRLIMTFTFNMMTAKNIKCLACRHNNQTKLLNFSSREAANYLEWLMNKFSNVALSKIKHNLSLYFFSIVVLLLPWRCVVLQDHSQFSWSTHKTGKTRKI